MFARRPEPDKELNANSAEELRTLAREIDHMAKIVERMNLGDYLGLLQRPGRLLWLNFLAGLARGLGTILGATLLVSLVVWIIDQIIATRLPGISLFFQEFLRLLHTQ
ncbi:MAG: DUF5665 domain-containing protein [Candidatus Eremiobacteraeota bacterium]|nr:DUF5665 domain-containing protein [Candidatus Eremiobacteraeota bacterium]